MIHTGQILLCQAVHSMPRLKHSKSAHSSYPPVKASSLGVPDHNTNGVSATMLDMRLTTNFLSSYII